MFRFCLVSTLVLVCARYVTLLLIGLSTAQLLLLVKVTNAHSQKTKSKKIAQLVVEGRDETKFHFIQMLHLSETLFLCSITNAQSHNRHTNRSQIHTDSCFGCSICCPRVFVFVLVPKSFTIFANWSRLLSILSSAVISHTPSSAFDLRLNEW